jgi:hypothetical protein
MTTPEQAASQILTILHNKWKPHPGQVKAGKALLTDGKKRVFIQCGRKWGKTEFVLYILTRWAALKPGSECCYYAPTKKNAKIIVWRRLKKFIPKEFLLDQSVEKAFKEQELIVRLWNDSIIRVDGADDEEAGRGVEPDVVVYDEYKDFKEGFHEGMEPNLEVKDAPLLFIGTPPDHENHFTQAADEIKKDPDGFYIEAPSTEGLVYGTPKGLKALKKIEAKCKARGDYAYFLREYMGKFVLGGAGSIFPMFTSERLNTLKAEEDLQLEVKRDLNKLQWIMFCDPGTTTCFAVLIAAFNPYTRRLYILDEIYEKNPEETSTRRIWPRIVDLMRKWNPTISSADSAWIKGYDEAAAWFAMEVGDSYAGISLQATNKKLNNKENGLSLMKDQMLAKLVTINDNCKNLIWEVENYVKDKAGNIPKKNDHLIDVWRYINSALGFTFDETEPDSDRFQQMGWRGVRVADEFDLEEIFDD